MTREKQQRLLVCDPDPQDQTMIQEFLQDSSIRVSFTSPIESLETTLSSQAPFDAVVIDLSNPFTKSCTALISAVKQASPRAQVIFMSRLADDLLWSDVLAKGAYDLLPKPPGKEEFRRTVFSAVQKRMQAA